MGKKILVLNGSPRKNSNTTALIAAFTDGAAESGNTITQFDLQGMNIHACLGCCKGGKNTDSPCVQKDDMDKIYSAYRSADVVVLASPMYYWSITGQLKCAFDRLFAVAECNSDYANPVKSCVLLMPAEGADEGNFSPVLAYYHALLSKLGWTDLGYVYAGGNMNPGDIEKQPQQLSTARTLGASIGRN